MAYVYLDLVDFYGRCRQNISYMDGMENDLPFERSDFRLHVSSRGVQSLLHFRRTSAARHHGNLRGPPPPNAMLPPGNSGPY